MKKQHNYSTTVKWTGNKGTGTSKYNHFERSHTISFPYKKDIFGSSDPAFNGDKTKHNPEELLIASLVSCHMLWYLHLCSINNITVIDYLDAARGTMIENSDGSGFISEVILNPIVIVTEITMTQTAIELHNKANKFCYIANSVNFKVCHNPKCYIKQ